MPISQDRLLGILEIAEFYQSSYEALVSTITNTTPDELTALQLQVLTHKASVPLAYDRVLHAERQHFQRNYVSNQKKAKVRKEERELEGRKQQTGKLSTAPAASVALSLDLPEVSGGFTFDPAKPLF